MKIDVARLLADMVRIDSRNTLPLDDPGPRQADEEEMACSLKHLLTAMEFTVELQYAAPRRPNLVAYLERGKTLPTLAFEAHMDTVGTDGMSIAPFDPVVENGRMFGRGAADTKGPMAAMLAALGELRTRRDLPLNLMFVASCSEETGCEGIRRLDLSKYRPDGIVVGEPTRNQPVCGHKSSLSFHLTSRGKAAHASTPENGRNAIYTMLDAVHYLRSEVLPDYQADRQDTFTPSTLSVGTIRGGAKVNIVPDVCRAEVDVRLVPARSPRAELEKLRKCLAQNFPADLEIENEHIVPAFAADIAGPLVASLCAGVESVNHGAALSTVSYCTDAGFLAESGYSTVIFGPGDILNAHGAVEYIELSELHAAVQILVRTAETFAELAAFR